MTTFRRAVTVVMVTAGLAGLGGASVAHAQDADEQFVKAVSSLGIVAGPDTDIPALGRNVCTTMTEQLAKNPNPPPVVRGIVSWLETTNMTKSQAVGFMRASVIIYCPQYGRYTGR